jgi:hypothetical protein
VDAMKGDGGWTSVAALGPQVALGVLPASINIALRLEVRQQVLSRDDQR